MILWWNSPKPHQVPEYTNRLGNNVECDEPTGICSRKSGRSGKGEWKNKRQTFVKIAERFKVSDGTVRLHQHNEAVQVWLAKILSETNMQQRVTDGFLFAFPAKESARV